MNQQKHYQEAEHLLKEGVEVVQQLSVISDDRREYAPGEPGYLELTATMDELGKKAMGIWAQAQVHATLANNRFRHADG